MHQEEPSPPLVLRAGDMGAIHAAQTRVGSVQAAIRSIREDVARVSAKHPELGLTFSQTGKVGILSDKRRWKVSTFVTNNPEHGADVHFGDRRSSELCSLALDAYHDLDAWALSVSRRLKAGELHISPYAQRREA